MSPVSELRTYVGRIRQFNGTDWRVYIAWVGMMLGLVGSTGGFLLFGHLHGVPAEICPECGDAVLHEETLIVVEDLLKRKARSKATAFHYER